MRTKAHCRSGGMTLVELLVVVAILVILSAVVLPNIAGSEGNRTARIAAESVSSHFAKAQSIAISRRASHGIWLTPLPNLSDACVDLSFASVPAPYRGDTFDAKFKVELPLPPDPPTQAKLTEAPKDCAASLKAGEFGTFSNSGNLVQFNDIGPLYDFRWIGPAGSASLRPLVGQYLPNTLLPASGEHRFVVHRLPTRTGQPLSLSNGMAIDVVWSGIATRRFGTKALLGDGSTTPSDDSDDWAVDPAYLAAGPAPALVPMFDASGAFTEMCYIANSGGGSTRFPADGPLLLLVGRVDRCGLEYNPEPTDENPGANWQYPDSRWIAIDPRTGAVKTAEVVLNVSTPTARQSQALIRAGWTTGGP